MIFFSLPTKSIFWKLQERSRSGSQFGALIEDCITNGKIVPVEITCSLLENAIIKTREVSTILLITMKKF